MQALVGTKPSRSRYVAPKTPISGQASTAMPVAKPSELACFTDDRKCIHAIVETPKGSRNKFAFDEKTGLFRLKKVLPVGMAFPYDFGFAPSTKAEDGDPVDVLVLMDEPAFTGCLLECRVIGIIEGEEGSKKNSVRNDRVVAAERANHSYADVDHIRQLGKKFVQELEEFFVNYHALSGNKYRVLDVKGPAKARQQIERGIERLGQAKAA